MKGWTSGRNPDDLCMIAPEGLNRDGSPLCFPPALSGSLGNCEVDDGFDSGVAALTVGVGGRLMGVEVV